MALTDTERAQAANDTPPAIESRLGEWWVIAGFAVLLLVILGWKFMMDPSISAPTRDPAWYTWRANVILQSSPVSVAQEWGPAGLFSGGYRITVPLAGALLQRVAGLDQYSFSAFLMIGVPVLTGLALGAGAFRSRRDPLVMLTTMLVSVALFLTTPYVGYLDNITVLFLLSLTLPFLHAARTSWGARTALFLIAVAAAFTHPTTCVIFGVVLLAVFGFHFLTSRFSFGSALRADGPMLMSVGFGMIGGLAMWVVGIWGKSASLADAALPPPYTKEFFAARLREWVMSLQPLIIGPLVLIAIVSTILLARRERRPADTYDQASIWWLLPFLGTLTVLTSTVVPYYRFMNASAAPMALAGLGAFVAIRWCLRLEGAKRVAGVLGVVADRGCDRVGLQRRIVEPVGERQEPMGEPGCARLARRGPRGGRGRRRAAERSGDELQRHGRRDRHQHGVRLGQDVHERLPHGDPRRHGQVQRHVPGDRSRQFLAGQQTTGVSEGYNDASQKHFEELQSRLEDYPQAPVVFLIGQYYKGLCNGETECTDQVEQERLRSALDSSIEVGPDTYLLQGDGLYTPSPGGRRSRARRRPSPRRRGWRTTRAPPANPLHTLRVLIGLFFLAFLPGLIAAPWFELRDAPSRVALIPGMSIVLTLLSGIARLGGLAGTADHHQGLGGRRARRPVRARSAVRGRTPEPCAGIVRRVLQQLVLGVLEPRLRHAGRGAVPGAGGAGRHPGRVREVDRVRR